MALHNQQRVENGIDWNEIMMKIYLLKISSFIPVRDEIFLFNFPSFF